MDPLNVKEERKKISELCLEVNTHKLEYLDLVDDVSEIYSMVDVSSLVGANVNLKIPLRCSGEQRDDRVKSIARLMQALHKVEDLHINVPTPSVRRTTYSLCFYSYLCC